MEKVFFISTVLYIEKQKALFHSPLLALPCTSVYMMGNGWFVVCN